MKRILLIIPLVALLAISLVAIGCEEEGGGVTPGEWGEPEYGGTIVFRASFIDVVTDPLDPRSPQFATWMESLFTRDITVPQDEFSFQGSYIPVEYTKGQIAESWEYKEGDPTTVIIKIRQGIKWWGTPTGGRELTAEDVEYTYNKILAVGEFAGQDPNMFFAPVLSSVEDCEATGPYTVEFHLKSAHPFAIEQIILPWLNTSIAPREWCELTPEEQADWHNAVGTGAFVPTDFVAGTSITTEANPDYYLEDARYPGNKLPYADGIKIIVIPDMDTALAAMRTGEIDLLTDARVYPSLAQTQAMEASNPEIIVFQQPVTAPALFFAWDTEAGVIQPPFDDINIRIAMQLAIDNDLIAETLYKGTVDAELQGFMSPLLGEEWDYSFDEWPSELQDEYTYDLDEAKALLADAGVTSLDFTVLTNPDDYPEVLEVWQSMLAKIGVNMSINSMEMMAQRPVIQQGDYEVLWTTVGSSAGSTPVDAINNFYSQKFEAVGIGNRVNDPIYDAFVNDFMAATTVEECIEIFHEADQYWLEQHWLVIGFPTWSNHMMQPWIEGYLGQNLTGCATWLYFNHMWINSATKAQYVD
jgi:peptide/nickel transport system substrate-binding protein